MSEAAPVGFVRSLAPEDQARANLYGLIARLFYAAPDEQLLGELLSAESEASTHEEDAAPGSRLDIAWRALLEASRNAYPVVLEAEHTTLFVGAGKCEVTPYLSNYVMRHEADTPLAELRESLNALGVARREGVGEYEDHVAGLMETMRFLIAVQQRPVEVQKDFFERFIRPGANAFCAAVSNSDKAVFYKHVAALAQIFVEIEQAAFDMP